ncbi:hypothetical protein [Sphingomonas sp. SRS2]|uniref:hypothetical protein n=1 Tax=Sphingomonas sp. SRS2 TaxID=133190 RepID=UPI0006184220|nr:hypothetical protein [Sphingomonas sp. SRS2]KKC25808.1 hypothetical protein WP12_12185 [Sphingomonas sp. SRS2]
MKHETFPPTSVDSFNVRERHELFDEDSRFRRELIRIGTEHEERVAEIKARFHADRSAFAVAKLERAA